MTKTETSLNATKEKDREIRSLGYSSPQMLNDINHVYSKECEMYRSVKKAIVDSYKLHYLFCFVFLGWEGILKKNIDVIYSKCSLSVLVSSCGKFQHARNLLKVCFYGGSILCLNYLCQTHIFQL